VSPEIPALLARARALDGDAWSQIYDQFYPRIFAFVLTRVRDRMLAEDLAADVFVNALRAIDTYEERGLGLAAWLFRIANNRLIDHYRQSGKRDTESLDEMDETGQRYPDGATTSGGLNLEGLDLQAAMLLLSPEQRQVVHLRFIEGLTSQQVAGVMKKTTAAVKIMQHRALKTLQKVLRRPVTQ
jgi:RNA polymerase sigma-70 factor (ECF subfamily)